MTSPDPVPPPSGPLAAIVTTEGMTWLATEVTGQALAVDEAAAVPALTAEPDDFVAPTIRPPATPPTTSAVPSAAHSHHRRELREGFVSSISAPHPAMLRLAAYARLFRTLAEGRPGGIIQSE